MVTAAQVAAAEKKAIHARLKALALAKATQKKAAKIVARKHFKPFHVTKAKKPKKKHVKRPKRTKQEIAEAKALRLRKKALRAALAARRRAAAIVKRPGVQPFHIVPGKWTSWNQ